MACFTCFSCWISPRDWDHRRFPRHAEGSRLSDSQVGVAGSAVLLGMTVFVLPFSFLADKGSKKHAVNLMSAVWGVGCTLCGLVSHLFLIVLGRFMVGIGNASYAPVSVSMLTSWTRRSRWGSVIGAYNSAMSVGLALGTTIAGVLAQHYGWRSAFLAVGGLTLLFTALSLFLPNVKNHVSAASADGKREHVKVREAFAFTLQNKTLILLGIGVGIANMGYTSMILDSHVHGPHHGLDVHGSGRLHGAGLPDYRPLITPFSGWLSDRLGLWSRRTRAWLGVPCFLILAAVFAAGFYYQIAACCAIGMFLFIIPVTGVHIATQELVPTRYKATAYGTYVTLLQGLGFFGPMLAGALSDAFGLQLALVYMQLVFVIGGLIMLVAGFTYVKDYNRARAMEA
ncbi:MAG: MFS transporter [Bilophila wadsworthia]